MGAATIELNPDKVATSVLTIAKGILEADCLERVASQDRKLHRLMDLVKKRYRSGGTNEQHSLDDVIDALTQEAERVATQDELAALIVFHFGMCLALPGV